MDYSRKAEPTGFDTSSILVNLSSYEISKYSLQYLDSNWLFFMGLCKPNRNRRSYLKGLLSFYINKVVEN